MSGTTEHLRMLLAKGTQDQWKVVERDGGATIAVQTVDGRFIADFGHDLNGAREDATAVVALHNHSAELLGEHDDRIRATYALIRTAQATALTFEHLLGSTLPTPAGTAVIGHKTLADSLTASQREELSGIATALLDAAAAVEEALGS